MSVDKEQQAMRGASPAEIRTERLLLRQWRADDVPPFIANNADPRVMEFFPALLTEDESRAAAARIAAHFETHGYGAWVVEIPGVAPFAGVLGLFHLGFDAPFAPCVAVSWRLGARYWNQGYATEGARAALAFGFERLSLFEIVALTVPANVRSRRVMEKLGMSRDPADDFLHPGLPLGHPLRHHVLYRIAGK